MRARSRGGPIGHFPLSGRLPGRSARVRCTVGGPESPNSAHLPLLRRAFAGLGSFRESDRHRVAGLRGRVAAPWMTTGGCPARHIPLSCGRLPTRRNPNQPRPAVQVWLSSPMGGATAGVFWQQGGAACGRTAARQERSLVWVGGAGCPWRLRFRWLRMRQDSAAARWVLSVARDAFHPSMAVPPVWSGGGPWAGVGEGRCVWPRVYAGIRDRYPQRSTQSSCVFQLRRIFEDGSLSLGSAAGSRDSTEKTTGADQQPAHTDDGVME